MISTENAGGLVGGSNTTPGTEVKIKMLIGTRVESLGRDARAGEVVTVSQKDAAFLLPYGYATRDLEDATEQEASTDEAEADEADEAELETGDETEEGEDATSASDGKRTGKRKA